MSGTFWLFSQILFCLLLAFITGVIIGWMLRRFFGHDEEAENLRYDEGMLTAGSGRTPELTYAADTDPGFFSGTNVNVPDLNRRDELSVGDDTREPVLITAETNASSEDQTTWRQRLTNLEQENTDLKAEVSRLENASSESGRFSTPSDATFEGDSAADLTRLSAELSLITRERDDQRKQIARLHDTLENAQPDQATLQSLRNQLNDAVIERDNARKETMELQRQLSGAGDQMAVNLQSGDALTDDDPNSVLQQERQAFSTERESLQRRISELEETATSLRTQAEEVDDARELRQSLTEAQRTNEANIAENRRLERDVQTLQTERDGLKRNVETLDNELAQLKQQVEKGADAEALEKQLIVARQDSERQQETIERMRLDINEIQSERQLWEKNAKEAEAGRTTLGEDLRALREDITRLTERAKTAEAESQARKLENEKVENQLTRMREKFAELETERDDFKERSIKLEKDYESLQGRAEEALSMESSLKNNVAEITKQRNAFQLQADRLQGELVSLKSSGVTYNDAADNARKALNETTRERDRLRKRLEDMDAELAELRGATAAKGDISDALRKQLEAVRADNAGLDQQIQKQAATIRRLERELASPRRGGSRTSETDDQLNLSLASESDHESPATSRATVRTAPNVDAAPADDAEQTDIDRGNTVTVAEEDRPSSLARPRQGQADDLKRIKGVGPKIEKTLWSLGVYHFDQIAEWSPQTCRWVSQHLEFPGRVERERWIEQAGILASGADTEFSKRYRK